jgi:hypothetical protein
MHKDCFVGITYGEEGLDVVVAGRAQMFAAFVTLSGTAMGKKEDRRLLNLH